MNTVHLILDRSGSMATHWNDTLGACNAYFDKLKTDAPDAVASVTMFDSEGIDKLREVPIAGFLAMTNSEVSPRGMTPLFDAVGRVVTDMKKDAAAYDERRVLVVMTDGEENASREYDLTKIKALLDECKANNWLVIFLGADIASWAQGQAIGVNFVNTMQYAAGAPAAAMRGVMRSTAAYMCATSAQAGMTNSGFTQEERDEAVGGDELATAPAWVPMPVPTPTPAPKFGERKW